MRSCPNSTGTGQDVSDLNAGFPHLTGDVSSGYKGLEIKKLTVRNQKNKSKNTGCHSQNQGNGQRSPDNQEKSINSGTEPARKRHWQYGDPSLVQVRRRLLPIIPGATARKVFLEQETAPIRTPLSRKKPQSETGFTGDKPQLYRNRNGTGSKSAPKSGDYHRLLF